MTAEQKITVYLSIGNSDDRLTQRAWSEYVGEVVDAVHEHAERVYVECYSASDARFQNACIGFEIPKPVARELRAALKAIREDHGKNSIVWAVAPRTEHI